MSGGARDWQDWVFRLVYELDSTGSHRSGGLQADLRHHRGDPGAGRGQTAARRPGARHPRKTLARSRTGRHTEVSRIPTGNITLRHNVHSGPQRNPPRRARRRFPPCPTAANFRATCSRWGEKPFDLLRYTLPSRYCDSDKLLNFAWTQFGQVPHGLAPGAGHLRLGPQKSIEYRFGSRTARPLRLRRSSNAATGSAATSPIRPSRSAAPSNLPARYATGHPARHRLHRPGHGDGFFTPTAGKSIWGASGSPSIRATMSRASAGSRSPTGPTRWTARSPRSTARPS